MSRAFVAVIACAFVAGCGSTAPTQQAPTVAGVRAMYRAVDAEAHAGHYATVCQRYMGERLQGEFKAFGKDCQRFMAELWAEGARLARVGPGTRVVVSGDSALVYDGVTPEKVLYVAGHWVLSESPESEQDAKTDEENQATEAHNKETEQHNSEVEGGEAGGEVETLKIQKINGADAAHTPSTETTPAVTKPAGVPQLVCVEARGYSIGEVRPSRCLIDRPDASDSETLDLADLRWTEWGPTQATATGEELGEHPGQVGSKPTTVRIVAFRVGTNPTTGAPMFTRVTEYTAGSPDGRTVTPY